MLPNSQRRKLCTYEEFRPNVENSFPIVRADSDNAAMPFQPSTWQEARMLALKKMCPRCMWWKANECAARQLKENTKSVGPLPVSVAEAMRDCRRDAFPGNPVRLDQL